MFKYKPSIRLNYERQGYIYFKSLSYNTLPKSEKDAIDELCQKAGGEYREALFKFVTTDTSATKICMEHYLSKATLYRLVRRYYETFPSKL